MKKVLLFLLTVGFVSQLNAYDKLSLVERFTNASCAPCASLNVWYNPLTHQWVNSGTISHLVYNVWWPGPNDPMYLLNQSDNTTRTNYYGCNYVPWFDVNGTHINETQGALTSAVTSGNSQFAPFKIEMTQEALSENLIKIGFTITRDPNDVTSFGNIKLRLALTEKTVSFATPPGSNGETEFYSICRKMLPDAGGSTFTIPAPGESTVLSLEYVPTAAFLLAVNLDSLRIVAFIQDEGTKMIYQSAMMEVVPNYLATFNSSSSDIIGNKNTPGEFTTILRNIGLMDDMYYINSTFDGPGDWTGGFTTINGNFAFGDTDSVQVVSGDSTGMAVTINPNGFNGSGMATLSFQSKNNIGMEGSVTFRFVTTTGIEILVIDASGEGYGNLVANSVANVFSGSYGVVSQSALNPSVELDNFQMITWSAGIALPVFHQDEVDALQDYLDNGGKLFINGQDIGTDVFGAGGQSHFAQGFYNYYLHTSFTGDVTTYLINGIPGDPITNGIQIVLNDIYPRSPENISPFDGSATSIFKYLSGPNIAAIKASSNNYKVVYFAFGFEQIPSIEIRDTLISRIINYFGVNVIPVELTSFTVVSNNGIVELKWQTATEKNNRGFEVQKQVGSQQLAVGNPPDDVAGWERIGFVEGKGTTTEISNYIFEDKINEPGTYSYRLKQIDFDGSFTYSQIAEINISSQKDFVLYQNYPNPFNPVTKIEYSTDVEGLVKLKIYDILGKEVKVLVHSHQQPGSYEVMFDGTSLSSGIYYYKLESNNRVLVKKLILMK